MGEVISGIRHMKYIDTRGGVSQIRFKDAVMMGLASDGGLMVPEAVPDVSGKLPAWSRLTYPELAFEVIRVFSDDINEDVLKRMTEESYSGFGHADVAPLRGIGSLRVRAVPWAYFGIQRLCAAVFG